MTKHIKIEAETRVMAGKGAARAVRREQRVPAVIYGDKKEPVMISLVAKDLIKEANSQSFFTNIFDIKVGEETHSVLPRDIQLHPVKDHPMHVDFLRITEKTMINVQIPVNVTNEEESPGVAKGGVISIIRHDVEVNCSAKNIPSEIVIDLTGKDVGDSVHIGELALPKGVTAVNDEKLTVLTIVAPSSLKSEEEVTTEETGEAVEGVEGAEASADAPATDAPAAEEKKK